MIPTEIRTLAMIVSITETDNLGVFFTGVFAGAEVCLVSIFSDFFTADGWIISSVKAGSRSLAGVTFGGSSLLI